MTAAGIGLATGVATTVLDCEDAPALAEFWSGLLEVAVAPAEDDGWASLEPTAAGLRLAFQQVTRHRAPGRGRPQQLHLDVQVADLDAGQARVVALGGALLRDGGGYRVFTDPAGHPFCLVTS